MNFRLKKESGLSILELLLVISMTAIIVYTVMLVYDKTQKSFRSSLAQMDISESGRSAIELVANDLIQISATDSLFHTNIVTPFYTNRITMFYTNLFTRTIPFYIQTVMNNSLTDQPLRKNVLQQFFLMSRQSDGWKGIGYGVISTNRGAFGSLYRWETNSYSPPFDAVNRFCWAMNMALASGRPNEYLHHVIDGVVSFRLIPQKRGLNYYFNSKQWQAEIIRGVVNSYTFVYTNLPSSLELELGIMESPALEKFVSMRNSIMDYNFLTNQSAKVHLFRQRVSIKTAN